MLLRFSSRLLIAFILACGMANAAFINGGFENGDTTGWSVLGDAVASTGENYGVGTVSPDTGNFAANLVASGVEASAIAQQMSIDVSALSASNGDIDVGDGSLIWQSIFATAGEVLQFRWNFVDNDYLPFDDWAFYGVQFESGATNITRLASVATVGPEEDTTIHGWTTLNVPITQSGNYTIYFGVVNGLDTAQPSEFWLDGADVGTAVPEPSTFALLLPVVTALFAFRRRAQARIGND